MSKTIEYLDAVKQKNGIETNYKLAKCLQIEEQRIHDYYKGIRKPDDYAATKIALALGLEPISVLAEINAESEKNPKKKAFWVSFLTRAALQSVLVAGLWIGFQETSEASAGTQKELIDGLFNSHNVKLCAWRRMMNRFRNWLFGASRTGVPHFA